MVRGADSGKKQQLRRIDSAAAKNYLLARSGLMRLAVLNVRDAGSALALPQQPGCMGVGLDPKVGALERRLQISVGSAVALPALLRHLVKAHSILLRTVEIIVPRKAELLAGRDKRTGKRVVETQVRHMEGATRGVVLRSATLL